MKIYNKIIIDIESLETIYENSFDYAGPIALCQTSGGVGDSIMFTNLMPTYIPKIQDWATLYLSQSLTLSANNYTAYTGETYAVQDGNETSGIAALVSRGTAGSIIESHGETFIRKLLAGGYIVANSYLDDAFQKLIDEVVQKFEEETLPSIEDVHTFSFGGSEHNVDEAKAAEKLMEIINSIAEKIYFDDYTVERRLQDAGIAHAVPYGQRSIRDAEILRSAGIYAREYTQGLYKDNWAKWNEAQIIPLRNLDIIGNGIRTIIGTSRTTTKPYYKPSAISEIAGLALTGISFYALSRDLTMSPYRNPAGKNLPIIDLPFSPIPPPSQDFGKFPSSTPMEQVNPFIGMEAPHENNSFSGPITISGDNIHYGGLE